MFLVTVNVRYLQSVINPEEEVLKETVGRIGSDSIKTVKLGRTYAFHVEADSKEAAEASVKEIAEKLLVNKAMETYSMDIEEA